jgi:hypothetical protein
MQSSGNLKLGQRGMFLNGFKSSSMQSLNIIGCRQGTKFEFSSLVRIRILEKGFNGPAHKSPAHNRIWQHRLVPFPPATTFQPVTYRWLPTARQRPLHGSPPVTATPRGPSGLILHAHAPSGDDHPHFTSCSWSHSHLCHSCRRWKVPHRRPPSQPLIVVRADQDNRLNLLNVWHWPRAQADGYTADESTFLRYTILLKV